MRVLLLGFIIIQSITFCPNLGANGHFPNPKKFPLLHLATHFCYSSSFLPNGNKLNFASPLPPALIIPPPPLPLALHLIHPFSSLSPPFLLLPIPWLNLIWPTTTIRDLFDGFIGWKLFGPRTHSSHSADIAHLHYLPSFIISIPYITNPSPKGPPGWEGTRPSKPIKLGAMGYGVEGVGNGQFGPLTPPLPLKQKYNAKMAFIFSEAEEFLEKGKRGTRDYHALPTSIWAEKTQICCRKCQFLRGKGAGMGQITSVGGLSLANFVWHIFASEGVLCLVALKCFSHVLPPPLRGHLFLSMYNIHLLSFQCQSISD